MCSESVAQAELPRSVAGAELGARVEEVRKKHQGLEKLDKDLGAPVLPAPAASRFLLPKQKVPGLEKPTDVELRFWEGKLWVVIVYFGENENEVVLDSLRKRLGQPTAGDALNPYWDDLKTNVTVISSKRYYAVSDRALSEKSRQWLAEQLRGAFAAGRQQIVPTPEPKGQPTK